MNFIEDRKKTNKRDLYRYPWENGFSIFSWVVNSYQRKIEAKAQTRVTPSFFPMSFRQKSESI